MSHFVLVLLVVGVVLVAFVALGFRGDAADAAANVGAAKKTPREQMAADIRATKTSRVADEVSIVDELAAVNDGYRQYCELVGTAQVSGGVTAPYSRREVAYYEIRCYRIENRGGGDVETLVAHERSFDPFYFTDGSCDTPVYVDLNSFGDNVILVNSTNHIEGPNSSFAKAADAAGGRAGGSPNGVSSIVGSAMRGVSAACGTLREGVGCVAAAVVTTSVTVAAATRRPIVSAGKAWHRVVTRVGAAMELASAPAYALAGGGSPYSPWSGRVPKHGRPRWLFADGRGPGGPRRPGGRGPGRPVGVRGPGAPRPAGPTRPTPIPPGMGQFLGGMGGFGGYSGVPRPRPRPNSDAGDMLAGMALGTLLATLAKGDGTQGNTPSTSTFRGYRLVEDVVPLGSPVYCIGELYRSGERHVIGRSLAADYPTSYFAARPEAEVLSRLGC